MNRPALIDLRMLLWDADIPIENYYSLVVPITKLLRILATENCKLVMGPSLQAEIWDAFPMKENHRSDPAYQPLRFFFAAVIRLFASLEVEDFSVPNPGLKVTSQPKLPEFSIALQMKIDSLFVGISSKGDGCVTFFSLEDLWNSKSREICLTAAKKGGGKNTVRIEVIIGDAKVDEIDKYLERSMNVFDSRYEKHIDPRTRKIKVGNRHVSPLSAYAGKNHIRCQELLEKAKSVTGRKNLFARDCDNSIWVVFRPSFGGPPDYRGNNEYHGHDEDDLSQIPAKIRALEQELCPEEDSEDDERI